MIRVLVAEDSNTARELLVEALRSDPEIRIVGEAKSGAEVVEMTRRLRPSVVTMDIRMPRMDGLEATERIMAENPTPIVVVSAVVGGDVHVAMNALRAGALAVEEKLPRPSAPEFEAAAQRLIDSVKSMSEVKVVRRWPALLPRPTGPRVSRVRRSRDATRAHVIAVAASTGGPAALSSLLSCLPGNFPAPILVVQHIGWGFVDGLVDWLDSASRLQVKVADDGEALEPGRAYVAPAGLHLGVTRRSCVTLSSQPEVGSFRPSATILFRSVAEAYGASALAVIMTGMGDDGLPGLRAIREAGGRILAQDEATSIVFGMPGVAVAAGLADAVLPLSEIPGQLLKGVRYEGV